MCANGFEKRVHIGLDYFDASINRVAAWTIGARNMLRALLIALLEPPAIKTAEAGGDFTTRLALQEEAKTLPFGAVWDYYCESQGVPVGEDWLAEVKRYEKEVLSQRIITTTKIMQPNPFLGVFFHWLGGLASGSFYVPYRGVKKWSWETYWLVGGFFSWIICPWVFASFMTNDLSACSSSNRQHAVVDVFLRSAVGFRRTDIRFDDALSRHVAGHGRGAGLLRGVRHAGAADFQGVHARHSPVGFQHC